MRLIRATRTTALAALLAGGVLAIGGAFLLLPALFGALAHQLAAPRLAELLEQLPTGAAASARFAAASGGAGVLHGGPSVLELVKEFVGMRIHESHWIIRVYFLQ